MQTKLRTKRRKPPSVSLSRKDMEHILGLFAKLRPNIQVQISDEDHEYDDLDDVFNNVGSRPKVLVVSVFPPSVRLTLSRQFVPESQLLYIPDGDEPLPRAGESLFWSLVEFLDGRKNWLAGSLGVFALVVGFLVSVLLIFWGSGSASPLPRVVFLAVGAGALAWSLIALNRRTGIAHMSLAPVEIHQTFWERHRDDVQKAVIGLIGTILGTVIGILIGKYWK